MDHEDTKEINESTRRTLKKWKTAVIVYGIFLFFFGPPIIIAVMAMPWSFNDLLNFFKMAYEDFTTFPNSIIRYLIMCLLAFLFSLPRLIVIYLFIKALILNRKTAAKVIIYIVIVVIEISVIWCFYSYYLARAKKPIIYLYPETRTEVNVKLDINGRLVTTYPAYDTEKGWKVTADPDGTLTDKKGRKYSYLYWEGDISLIPDLSKGYCVKGEDTAQFLESILGKLGLTDKEADDFITFWLPEMAGNKYNVISFQTTAYEEVASLKVNPKPDTVIRINMLWYASNSYVDIKPQDLNDVEHPERKGFTVVEWGGEEYKKGVFNILFK